MDLPFSPEIIIGFLGEMAATEYAKTAGIFALAAWIHSGRVKSEIKAQCGPLTQAVREMGEALRQDLSVLSERTGKVEEGLSNLKNRVIIIETKE